jgi:hypothetical protein
MTCKLKCTEPEQIKYTITMTATAEEWERLREEITPKNNYVFCRTVSELLAQANQTFTTKEVD